MGLKSTIPSVLPILLVAGCVYPTERSDQLVVEMDPIPVYRQGEIDTLVAMAVTTSGDSLPDVEILFQSSNSNALTITPEGALQATGPGISVISARAVGFQNTPVVEQLVTVKAPVAVDSVRPRFARFGQTVRFYGAGLNPDSLILIEMGGVEVPDYSVWTAANLNKPNGLGVLDVWVSAPTPLKADIRVAGVGGGANAADSLRVTRRDIYEPNDSIPTELGSLPLGFFNPALAFEQRFRQEIGADWYRFDQSAVGDRTILVFSDQTTTQAFRAYVTQPGIFSRDPDGEIAVTGPGWALGGPGVQVCGGVPFTFDVLAGAGMVAAIANVPVGSYELLIPYGALQATRYAILILNGYVSELAPDGDEENDVCQLAKPLTAGESKQLTIDNSYDTDWFSFSPPANVNAVFSTAVFGDDSTGNAVPELDIFVFHETANGIVPIGESASSDIRTDVAAVPLQANENYLVLVTDFAGQPTRYSLTLTVTPAAGASAQYARLPLEKIRLGVEPPTMSATPTPAPMSVLKLLPQLRVKPRQ